MTMYLFWRMEFAGITHMDQPVRLQVEVRNDAGRLSFWEGHFRYSGVQIPDPRVLKHWSIYSKPAKHTGTEAELARSLWDFLDRLYLNYSSVEKVWVGDFWGSIKIHQLRAFFFRHGLKAFWTNRTTFQDTTHHDYSRNTPTLDSLVELFTRMRDVPHYQQYQARGSDDNIDWLKPICAKRIPFRAQISEFPTCYNFDDVSDDDFFNHSLFIPLAVNQRGAILFDAGAWHRDKGIYDPFSKPGSNFFVWINYSSVFAVRHSLCPSDKKLLDSLKNSDCKRHLLERSPDKYFDQWTEANKHCDPEMDFYKFLFDAKLSTKLGMLHSAIYTGGEKTLKASGCKWAGLLYLRHLMREAIAGTKHKVDAVELNEIKEFALSHMAFRYSGEVVGAAPYGFASPGLSQIMQGVSYLDPEPMIMWHNATNSQPLVRTFIEKHHVNPSRPTAA